MIHDGLEIFIDGASKGNPGEAAVGIIINKNGQRLKEIAKTIGEATNNVAEYTALIYALQEVLVLKADKVCIHTDSELVFHQVTGSYKVKDEKIKLLFEQVKHLISGIKDFQIKHVPREQNKDADRIATQVIKEKQAKMAAPLFKHGGEESPSSEG